jgi:hypothetical protein
MSQSNLTTTKVENGYVVMDQETGRMVEILRPTKRGNPWRGFDFDGFGPRGPRGVLVVEAFSLREALVQADKYFAVTVPQIAAGA